MSTWLIVSLFIFGITTLSYLDLGALSSFIILVLLSVLVSFVLPIYLITLLWFLMLVGAILFFCKAQRIKWFTGPLLKWFRKQQPTISAVEKEVLDAGGLWWEKELFTGKPNWRRLLSYELPRLSQEEQQFLDDQTETLCSLLNDWKIVHKDQDLSKQAWAYIKKEGFWGLVIDKEHGGHGFSAYAHLLIISKIASRSLSCAMNVMVPNSLGPATFISMYGTENQKAYYLPRLAEGKEVGCFALTAPEAGSDASAINDTGIVCKGEHEGKEVLGIKLTFNKRYITLAPIATLIGLAFKLYDPDQLLGDIRNIGISCALVPVKLAGIEIGARHNPLNVGFMNGPIKGKDVFVPIDSLIGGAAYCGKGWKMMMECLAIGRGISLPSLASAASKIAFKSSSAYAQLRHQFKRPIGEFEGVSSVLARITGYNYLCEATSLFTTIAVEQGKQPAIASAIAKYHLTELARKSVNHAMDIHGGRGIQMGPRNYLANLYSGIPISITVEGANILTRNLIIFGQGVMRAHPFIQKEILAAEKPETKRKRKKFDAVLLQHIGSTFRSVCRALIDGLTAGYLIRVPGKGKMRRAMQRLSRMSNAFALVTDMTLLTVGKKLKFKETLSARLGDVLSELYLASSVLFYYSKQKKSDQEALLVEWCMQYCLGQMQRAFDRALYNYPNRWLGILLRALIFPLGRSFFMPRDSLGSSVAKDAQLDSTLRDRLTQCCYIGDKDDAIGRIEHAFKEWVSIKPILSKLNLASGIHSNGYAADIQEAVTKGDITAQEAEEIERILGSCLDALQVDEF